MPEYSSTTITPADGVQVPSMNGSTSGNFLLSALRDYILASKGQANGLASLGSDGKLTASQLPDLADDVIVVASYAVLPATGTAGKIYITADNNKMYRWDADLSTPDYVELSVDLSEYAKLTDLAAEESARETADTNLNNALTAIDHRLDNLEQAKGDYVVSNYKDGSVTPSGKGNWAVVEGLRGVSRVENQLMPALASGNGYYSGNTYSSALAFNDGVCTVTVYNNGFDINYNLSLANGRTYLVFVTLESSVSTTIVFRRYNNTANVFTQAINANQKTNIAFLFTPNSDSSAIQIIGLASANETLKVSKWNLRDLTIHFGGTIPSDADTIAEIQQNYPELLVPSAYNAGSLVDSTYSAVKSVGRNLFEGVLQAGGLDYSTGAETLNYSLRRSPYIAVKPSTEYYFLLVSGKLGIVHFYDFNKNHISVREAGGGTLLGTSPANAFYVRFASNLAADVSLWDSADICVNKSDALNGTYTPYMTDTLTLPSPVTLKGAGSVAEELDVDSGEVTHPIGTRTYSANEVGEDTSAYTNVKYFYVNKPSNSRGINTSEGYGFTTKYLIYPYYSGAGASSWDDAKCVGNCFAGFIYSRLYFGFAPNTTLEQAKAQIDGLLFQYELATPDPSTFVTPILDNTLLTESGGRMATVQTGTVVDGSFDMGFITL